MVTENSIDILLRVKQLDRDIDHIHNVAMRVCEGDTDNCVQMLISDTRPQNNQEQGAHPMAEMLQELGVQLSPQVSFLKIHDHMSDVAVFEICNILDKDKRRQRRALIAKLADLGMHLVEIKK